MAQLFTGNKKLDAESSLDIFAEYSERFRSGTILRHFASLYYFFMVVVELYLQMRLRTFVAALSFHAVASLRQTAIPTVYRRHLGTGPPGLTSSELRRALASAGADVGPSVAMHLIDKYGDERSHRVRLKGFDALVRSEPRLYGARFWLALDPQNRGLRASRLGFARFARAGSRSPLVLMHFVSGIPALVFGMSDMLYLVVTGGTGVLSHETATMHALCHCTVAFFSLWRFHYVSEEWWKFGLATSREANMWPSFVIAVWYTLALNSNLMVLDASIHMSDTWFRHLSSIVASVLVLYGLARGWEEDLSRGDRHMSSMKASLFSMTPVLTDTSRALLFGHDKASEIAYTRLLGSFPAFGVLQPHLVLGALFAGSLMCALYPVYLVFQFSSGDASFVRQFVDLTLTVAQS